MNRAREIVTEGGSGIAAKAALELMSAVGDIKGIGAVRDRGTKGIGRMAVDTLKKMDREQVEAVLGPNALPKEGEKRETPEALVQELLAVRGDARRREPIEDKLIGTGDAGYKAIAGLAVDDSPELRGFAVDVLSRFPTAKVLDLLLAAASDPVVGVRCRAALALGRMDDPRAVGATRAALADEDWCIRLAAVRGVGIREDAGAATLLREALRDQRWDVRLASLDALAERAGADAVPMLVDALEDEHWSIVSAAHSALATLTQRDFGLDVAAWREWLETSVEEAR
jgi:hypothetical protein